MAILRPISTHITQAFTGAFYLERPGWLQVTKPANRARRTKFTGSSYRRHIHQAIDYGAPIGTPVRAVESGVIVRQGRDSTGGWFVKLRVRRGLRFQVVALYYHLKPYSLRFKTGARVSKGAIIALSGNSGGKSTGGHLHFALQRGGILQSPRYSDGWLHLDPQPFINGTASLSQVA